MASRPVVAIVGRPNVGKSTLFNRIARTKAAIVQDEPGITRDRLYASCEWQGRSFLLVDTGGFDPHAAGLLALVRRQAEIAIAEADVVVLVVDARQGIHPLDVDVAQLLRRSGKPVVVAANKVDAPGQEVTIHEFHALGLGDPVPVSAEHGRNVGDLLSTVVSRLPESPLELPEERSEEEGVRVAIIGRPNVGKSSLVNAILGHERVIVSEIPGTTRDAVDVEVRRGKQKFHLVDTAGLRRWSKVDNEVEYYSTVRTHRAIERCHVAVVVLDATTGVVEQDKRVAGYGHEEGKGVILVANKWDLMPQDREAADRFEAHVRLELAFLDYAPLLYVSARTGYHVGELLDLIAYVSEQRLLRVSPGRLRQVLAEAQTVRQPPSDKGINLEIYEIQQVRVAPPTFALWVNRPELLHISYQRYLENQLRAAFGFVGTPIRFEARFRSPER